MNRGQAEQAGDRLLAGRLARWYRVTARDLPWRASRDPYRIWVSEVMAQQTRIQTVIPYYGRFLAAFPDVGCLARASEEEVLSLWSGLGYYQRAHNMQRAARQIVAEHGGCIPRDPLALRRLPGVGEYMAGAILSIAFSQPVPAVDANVRRVYARWENDDAPVHSAALKKNAEQKIRVLMDHQEPGLITQALMELGALLCVPGAPRCRDCPARTTCRARQAGTEETLPRRPAPRPRPVEEMTVLLVENPAGEILVRRRTEKLLEGMAEYLVLPGVLSGGEIRALLGRQGLEVRNLEALGPARHEFSHRVWSMEGFWCAVSGTKAPPGYRFLSRGDLAGCPLPRAFSPYTDRILGS